MVNALGHHLNKPVLVSIPPVFGNAELHRCRLVGTETAGVWLESDDFTRITGMGAIPLPALIFVPFVQIACLAAAPPALPPAGPARAEPKREENKPPRAGTRQKGRQPATVQTRATQARRKQEQ
jgi:hypothetical protein